MDRTVAKIIEELEYPPAFLISNEQFSHVEGASIEGDYGICAAKYPVFTIRKGLRGRVKENVIYHEVAHILFPNRPHWWVECFAEKMARGGGRGYWSAKFNKTVDDLPPRSRLLDIARRASRRLKKEL